jgi:uncharacterized membrane protein YbhN (UPF0104 family)
MRKHLWLALKTLLAIAILVGVTRYFARILSDEAFASVRIDVHYEYLVPAGLLYLLAHCCWASFWIRLLRGQGIPVSWYGGFRAYFVSQFGKYIPGKAMVILLRVGMLGSPGTKLAVGVTATYETLTSMASGALLGVLLLPYAGVLPAAVSGNVILLAGVAALPVVLGVLNRIAVRLAARWRGPDARPLPSPSPLLLAQGLLHGACGWCLLGLSLGLVIHAIVPDPPAWNGPAYLGDLAAVSLAYVLGFIVLVAPGGIGVRELVLQQALAARLPGPLAVIVVLVLRLAWTIAELVIAAVLLLRGSRSAPNAGPGVMRQA